MTQQTRNWQFDVTVDHEPRRTRAQIVLRAPEGYEFSGVGLAHRSGPARVSGYLALGRAMSDLTEELLEAAMIELEVEADRVWSS
ncbi:dsRBD fold-containing protein [Amycolatopsis tolypomycina]|uniref:dsRBD fold-containing protein n=1 Tax=Amycolatopsis tolypomycina TaxID=208445 RepID=UPI0033B1CA7B